MDLVSSDADAKYARVVRAADSLVVGLDFDGVLAPIVEDPDRAVMHPRGREVLIALGQAVHEVAVITGRPARQAIALGGLDEVGAELGNLGRDLQVLGQYGNERWNSRERRVVSPKPPAGIATVLRELPALLRRLDAAEAHVEEKGLAVGVHTRRLPDGEAAFDRLVEPLTELAQRHGLVVEPGKKVIEIRATGMDKGHAVRTVVAEAEAGGVVFIGDDLGDVEAFKAVRELGHDGLETLLVCSGSPEESALIPLADAVVPGPDGVMDFLDSLVSDISQLRV